MTENKPKSVQATTAALSDRDFDHSLRPKRVIIQKSPYLITCKRCGKHNYIPTGPIKESSIMTCKCGQRLAQLLPNDADRLPKTNE